MKSIILVGDKFQEFSERQQNVVTLSRLERLAWEAEDLGIEQIVVGQGVCHRRFSFLQSLLNRQSKGKSVSIVNYEQIANQHSPLLRQLAHKHNEQNVLISVPEKINDQCYQSKLAIHDASELLLDHITGQHIQGMVLTEAARQMMLAVAELFMLEAHERNQFYFVLNKVNSDYLRFAFPVDTDVRLTIQHQYRRASRSLHAEIAVEFFQQKENLTKVNIDFSAYGKNYIAEKEHSLAKNRIEQLVNELEK